MSFAVIGFPVELELEAVQDRRLFGLGFDALRHQIRVRHRPFGRVEQHLFQLRGRVISFNSFSVLEQLARFGDDAPDCH